MKLLIVTQAVDLDNPILGFFHGWIKEFSKKFESIVVICLEKGGYDLPRNVKVLSLGKENKKSRLVYIWNFYRYIWQARENYDAVFVHMNQEYVLLGGLIWKILNKNIYMWRNHHSGNIFTDIASLFCTNVFCTSKFSYTAKYKRTVIMPVGVDTDIFKPNISMAKIPKSILSLGRIAPSKNIHVFIDALLELDKKGIDFTASIYGDAKSEDIQYYESLENKVRGCGLGGKVSFYKGISNQFTPKIYWTNEIFVNLSPSGMLDKTIFEAMLCGVKIISVSRDLASSFKNISYVENIEAISISNCLEKNLKDQENGIRSIEDISSYDFSLNKLAILIYKEINAPKNNLHD